MFAKVGQPADVQRRAL